MTTWQRSMDRPNEVSQEGGREASRRLFALVALCALLMIAIWWSIWVGAKAIAPGEIISSLFAFDGSYEHLIIQTVRLPRVVAGLLVGSGLAISGAIMQAMTNNPLASPGLLGINAGATFAVVMTMSMTGSAGGEIFVWSAFGGAFLAAMLVYLLGTSGAARYSAVRLVLAGAVMGAFLMSWTTAVLIYDQSSLDNVRHWTAGSLAGLTMEQILIVLPYMLIGLAASLIFTRQFTALSLGSEISRSLGQHPIIWRSAAAGIVVLLAGAAVALAGPIGFVGLIVPHIVRFSFGFDYRWIVPFSGLIGALLVILADASGRLLFSNQNFPVGVTMALIGAPFFVWLARLRGGDSS